MHHRSGQLRCPLLGPLRRRVPLRFVLPRDSSGWPLASTGDRPACLPAYLPTYLPTDSRSNHLPTTSSRVWQKKPWMLGPARGRDRSIDCKLTREMVGGDPATIPDSVLWLARASFCTSFGKSHSN